MWIDDMIRRAMEDGHFDNLPGQGKPLNLNHHPYTPRELRGAYQVMQQAGATLPWISDRQTIEADIEKARAAIKQAWQWYLQQGQTAAAREAWQGAQNRFRQATGDLNRRIRDYNLSAPNSQVHLFALDAEREIQKAKQA